MLEDQHAVKLIKIVWDKQDHRVHLSEAEAAFLEHFGPMSTLYDDGRQYRRHHLRCRAVLQREETYQAIYVKDVSRKGVGFLCAEQLFPSEVVRLWLPTGCIGPVEIRRCRRIQEQCYECGGDFHSCEDPTPVHRLQAASV